MVSQQYIPWFSIDSGYIILGHFFYHRIQATMKPRVLQTPQNYQSKMTNLLPNNKPSMLRSKVKKRLWTRANKCKPLAPHCKKRNCLQTVDMLGFQPPRQPLLAICLRPCLLSCLLPGVTRRKESSRRNLGSSLV